MQNVVIYKISSVKGLLSGRSLSDWGPEPPYTLYSVYSILIYTGKGDRVEPEKGRGATVHKVGLKIPT
jgi:hypothetical protein